MKDKWRNYALSPGKIKENYQSKYIDRSKSRKIPKSGDCNSSFQGWEEQKEIINSGEDDESIRKKHVIEAYQERRQGVSSSDQRRCEAEKIAENNKGKIMKKETKKAERKHEAKETKAYERKEDKKENKPKKK
jgi:hypothetical protein